MDTVSEQVEEPVPEQVEPRLARSAALADEKRKATAQKKKERAEERHNLKKRTLKYDKKYAAHTAVPYTHLTLPTIPPAQVPSVAVPFQTQT